HGQDDGQRFRQPQRHCQQDREPVPRDVGQRHGDDAGADARDDHAVPPVPVPVAAHVQRGQPHLRRCAAAVPAAVLTFPGASSMDLSRFRRGTGLALRPAIALLACMLLAACTQVTMYGDLEERQANEVFAALLAANVDADKRTSLSKAGWEIRVDRTDFAHAMQVLQARGLPRQQYLSMCDVFKKEGIASSSVEENARYLCSRQQELARTLSGYPGVVDARVHIALAQRDPLGGADGDSSAS